MVFPPHFWGTTGSYVIATVNYHSIQLMPRRQSNRPALVRGDHVVLPARVRHIRAEALRQRIWHADEELHARRLQRFHKSSNINHPHAQPRKQGRAVFS